MSVQVKEHVMVIISGVLDYGVSRYPILVLEPNPRYCIKIITIIVMSPKLLSKHPFSQPADISCGS